MAEDNLATLGIVVTAGDARREVRLTRDEIIALANDVRAIPPALRAMIPPSVIPPSAPAQVNRFTEAIQRMRAAAAQSTADAFGSRLAIEMDKATQSTMRLQRGLDGIVAARQRMQQTALVARDQATAGQLAGLDPFQGAGFGPQFGPALPAHMANAGAAAGRASMDVGKLRQGMTSLAIAAGAVPGPIGRVASSLAPFALGGGVTVAVLAGLTAIAFGIEHVTRSGREARDLMSTVRSERLQFTGPALAGAIDMGRAREQRLSTELFALQSGGRAGQMMTDPIGAAVGVAMDLMRIDRVTRDLAEEREFLAAATRAAAKAERDLATEVSRAAEDRLRLVGQQGFERVGNNFGLAGLAGNVAFAQARNPWDPNAGSLQTLALERQRNEYDAINASIEAARKLMGENLLITLASIEAEKRRKDAIAEGNYDLAQRLTTEKQISGAKMHLGQFGIGVLAGRAGPFGGLISGVGQNILQGNAPGAAASAVTGLVDGLLSLAGASKQAREAARLQRLEYAAFTDSVRLQLGEISESEAYINQLQREYDERRRPHERQLEALAEQVVRNPQHADKLNAQADEARRRIEELNKWEQLLIEQRRKEADEVERLANAMRNAPSGFYVEKYLRRIGAPTTSSRPPDRPGGWGGGAGSGGGNSTVIDLSGSQFVLAGGTPQEVFHGFVKILREKAGSTGGAGMPLSDALDLMN